MAPAASPAPLIPRSIVRAARQRLAGFPVVTITGPRQSGTTTLLRAHCAAHGRKLTSLDDVTTLTAARGDPTGLLAERGLLEVEDVADARVTDPRGDPRLVLEARDDLRIF